MKVVLVSQFVPASVGHGGDHRAYQILHDLQEVVGIENVIVASLPRWRKSHELGQPPRLRRLRQSAREVALRIGRRLILPRLAFRLWRALPFLAADDPIELLCGTGLTAKRHSTPGFISHCQQIVASIGEPAVSVIEHAGFASLVPINSQYGIPTIGCVQNLESLDTAAPLRYSDRMGAHAMAVDLADEWRALARCKERLFISKVETSLMDGLGLPSHYYPYRPVGAIRENLGGLRRTRAERGVSGGLFLMLGSAEHRTTWESFSWFVQNAADHGLPRGTEVVVGGSDTDRLLPPGVSAPGLQLRGWLEQEELDELLACVRAALVPQRAGFGGLTRLPELACAGVPAIVSRHPTHALDIPPGMHIADDSWDSWCLKMEELASTEARISESEYIWWEERQESTLQIIVEETLADL